MLAIKKHLIPNNSFQYKIALTQSYWAEVEMLEWTLGLG